MSEFVGACAEEVADQGTVTVMTVRAVRLLRMALVRGAGPALSFVIVCERCSVVNATLQAASRCRLCAKSRPRKEGAFRIPVTHPEMPWLVTGDRTVYVRTCEQCGATFAAQRASARTCSTACRVARARGRED